jgi:hypothetical protein
MADDDALEDSEFDRDDVLVGCRLVLLVVFGWAVTGARGGFGAGTSSGRFLKIPSTD